MSQITGTIQIASSDPSSPRVLNWRANKRFPNVEQACPDGYTGDVIPAGTRFADTQEAADALAAADLVCVPNGAGFSFVERFEGPGFSNTWTASGGGTADDTYASSPAPLEGSYSLRLSGALGYAYTEFDTVEANSYLRFSFWLLAETETDQLYFVAGLFNTHGNPSAIAEFNFTEWAWTIDSGETHAGSVVSGQKYTVWLDHLITTDELALYVSTGDVKPETPIVSLSSAALQSVGGISFDVTNTAGSGSVIVDDIEFSTSPV